jgi:hypothetical protein
VTARPWRGRLPFTAKGTWHSRWLVLPSWNRLHRIAVVDGYNRRLSRQGVNGEPVTGVSACGQRGRFAMPGVASRLGLERCAACCERVGVEPGKGAPYNQGVNK